MRWRCWLARTIRRASLLLPLVPTTGCARLYERLTAPPGTLQQQHMRAALFDPFADPDAGPAMVETRPREFQQPLTEADRTRWVQSRSAGGR